LDTGTRHVPKLSLPPVPVVGLDHIAYSVADLEGALRDLERALGARLVRRWHLPDAHAIGAAVQMGPVFIVLSQGTHESSPIAQLVSECGSAIDHVAYRVSDLEETRTVLRREKVELLSDVVENEGVKQLMCRIRGARLEFVERKTDVFTLPSVDRLMREVGDGA
jgi:4-hydroxyphenylpyruvate dioxygenase-like putative hemolysin